MIKPLFIYWNPEDLLDSFKLSDDKDIKPSFTFNLEQSLKILSHERIDIIIIKEAAGNNELIVKLRLCSPEIPILFIPKVLEKNMVQITQLLSEIHQKHISKT